MKSFSIALRITKKIVQQIFKIIKKTGKNANFQHFLIFYYFQSILLTFWKWDVNALHFSYDGLIFFFQKAISILQNLFCGVNIYLSVSLTFWLPLCESKTLGRFLCVLANRLITPR